MYYFDTKNQTYFISAYDMINLSYQTWNVLNTRPIYLYSEGTKGEIDVDLNNKKTPPNLPLTRGYIKRYRWNKAR